MHNNILIVNKDIVYTNWIAISGAPSSGKTSVINNLEKMGYEVVNDKAREVLEEARKLSPERDFAAIQLEIVERMESEMRNVNPDKLTLFDYGMPDNIAFQRLGEIEIAKTLKLAKKYIYKAVLILEPISFKCDGLRDKDREHQHLIHEMIVNIYEELGYKYELVPDLKLEDRVQYVHEKIRGLK